jgi:cytochrome P450 family 4
MGRDPEIWDNPEEFQPERFDVVQSSDKFTYSYIPFSAGQRNCIGQKFAMLEMKSTITKILRHFTITTPKDFEPIDILRLVTKSENGILIGISERIQA